ncbi:MAG: CvpA family protein [Candidatus Omnitrophota bacterium]
MAGEILTVINWVDIILAIAAIRIVYIGFRQGFIVELFKTLGIFLAAIVSLHYYIELSDLIALSSFLTTAFADPLCFVLLIGVIVIIFKFARDGFNAIFKVEPIRIVKTWGGFLLGLARALIFSSLLIYGLLISGSDYIAKSARQSFSANRLMGVAPAIYTSTFEKIISKFFPSEQENGSVVEITRSSQHGSRKK